jgi:hypothetical protein
MGIVRVTRALLLMLASCGSAEVVMPTLLPPNVGAACDKAIACGVFLHEQKPECIACVEKLAELYDEQKHGKLPPLDEIPCEVVAKFSHDSLVSECVVRRSFGP